MGTGWGQRLNALWAEEASYYSLQNLLVLTGAGSCVDPSFLIYKTVYLGWGGDLVRKVIFL